MLVTSTRARCGGYRQNWGYLHTVSALCQRRHPGCACKFAKGPPGGTKRKDVLPHGVPFQGLKFQSRSWWGGSSLWSRTT